MNIYDNYNVDYYNADKKLAIKVISHDNKLLGILMDHSELVLEVHYDKQLKNFILLNGSLGEKLQQGDFSSEQKLERILEVFNNKLHDYFNNNVTHKNKPIP